MTIEEFKALKIGDKLICIDNSCSKVGIIINHIYIITKIDRDFFNFSVKTDYNKILNCPCLLFMSLRHYEIMHRKDKIKKILCQ